MKAYQINIEMIDSNPPVWRRVIMPADVTFNRLHDVIQTVTNFQSGYPSEATHLFEFNLKNDNIRVTNDEEAYEEHKHFMKNCKKVEEMMMRNTDPKFAKFQERQIENLKTVIRKPVGIKIDTYLERNGYIFYTYDFGDNWQFIIELENILEDYKFGYPTLMDGAETAPPEDVGGLYGFEEFMRIYYDKKHPDHQNTKAWALEQGFREYDADHINRMLKGIQYKKNDK